MVNASGFLITLAHMSTEVKPWVLTKQNLNKVKEHQRIMQRKIRDITLKDSKIKSGTNNFKSRRNELKNMYTQTRFDFAQFLPQALYSPVYLYCTRT